MGLAASQARLLFVTARKGDVEFSEMKVANEKIALSRESAKASEVYSDALNARKLTWAVDGTSTSDDTVDLDYNLLMRPNSTADAGQYIYTNTATGKVILDSAYTSGLGLPASGNAGSLSGTMSKTEFVEKLTGCDELTADAYINQLSGGPSAQPFTTKYNPKDILTYLSQNGTPVTDEFIAAQRNATQSQIGYTADGNNSAFCFYNTKRNVDTATLLGVAASTLKPIVITVCSDTASALSNNLNLPPSTMSNAFQKATAATIAFYDSQVTAAVTNRKSGAQNATTKQLTNGTNNIVNDRSGNSEYYVDLDQMAITFMAYFDQACAASGGDASRSTVKAGSPGSTVRPVVARVPGKSVCGGGTGDVTEIWDPNGGTVGTDLYGTSFYLNLYDAIDSFGWQTNNETQSKEYLQAQILFGNMEIKQMQSDGSWSSISTGNADCPLRNEADTEAVARAEAEYNTKKLQIDSKEQKLDFDMKNLDTERSALDTEIDSVKAIINKNIERTFKMFQA